MAEGTQLAERGKEKLSAAAAIELVKKFVKDRYKEDKANSDHALAEARTFAGGQIERLDKDVIDQGRQWATRLALISRTTAGTGYQTSKSSQQLAGLCKKVFAIIGELEATMATDTEISLFQKVDETDYFGFNGDLKKMNVGALTEHCDPGDSLDRNQIVDLLVDGLGEQVEAGVTELLNQYEIEPFIVPEAPEGEQPSKNGRRRKRS